MKVQFDQEVQQCISTNIDLAHDGPSFNEGFRAQTHSVDSTGRPRIRERDRFKSRMIVQMPPTQLKLPPRAFRFDREEMEPY